MRLDRYLFFTRLLKSRTQAQALIEEGRVRVGGHRATKASVTVTIGQVIALPLRGQVKVLRVTALPSRRGPAGEARNCYEELGESPGGANVSQQGTAD